MKIVLTGSLGHISKPLAQTLLQQGHEVTIISHSEDRRAEIEALGAKAAIGSIADVPFLTKTFTGADAVYAMSPPDLSKADMVQYQADNGRDYAEAIKASGVKRVIFLSSFGAHRAEGTGIIVGKYHAEKMLAKLKDVSITSMRPTSFYYNFRNLTGMIKNAGAIYANYGGDDIIPMVAPEDIADAIADELAQPSLTGLHIRYVGSDERTGHEVAKVLGAAIGKPDLEWRMISDEEAQRGFEQAGFPPKLAADFTEMYGALRGGGAMAEDYAANRPPLGRVKLEDYAKEFAELYRNAGDQTAH